MPSPTGSATTFSIGIVYLGYWGIHEAVPWRLLDAIVVVLALAGFACLALVPWTATRPVEMESSDDGVRVARRLFLGGVSAIWLAVTLSVFI